MTATALLLAWALNGGAAASGGPGAAPGGGPQGMVGIAVIVPTGTEQVLLTAQYVGDRTSDPVIFTDDGSVALDLRDDGEWWALLDPRPGVVEVRVAGTIDGNPITHDESVLVPTAWMSTTYPVTLLAIPRGTGSFELVRTLMGSVPLLEDRPTGSGVADSAEQLGLSPAVLYLSWGFLLVAAAASAAVRSALARARADQASR